MKMITEATVPVKVIETVVREAIERETGRKIKRLEWLTGSRWEGYGPGEREVKYFDGVHVTFE
jgi:hypothetical protein